MIAIAHPESGAGAAIEYPTAWGLRPHELHDSYWAARGVQVVRRGGNQPVRRDAEQYLLLDPRTLVLFRLRGLVDLLSWVQPRVLFLRVRSLRDQSYREVAVTDDQGRFSCFRRDYSNVELGAVRVALTRDHALAEQWRTAQNTRTAWRQLRRGLGQSRREVTSLRAYLFDGSGPEEVARFMRCLVDIWPHPASVVAGVNKVAPGVWVHREVKLDPTVRFVGNVWVGAGRSLPPGQTVLGPAVLWDDPACGRSSETVPLDLVEPMPEIRRPRDIPALGSWHRIGKRVFDIAFAVLALLFTLPIYPFVMLAIYLEDGRPFFFGHWRESMGGREFPCIKFRSMRKDAEQIKAKLVQANQADGPQFFIEHDPRLTRTGSIIRKLNIDELPQFINVLLGHMSVVGPRPSPYKENQCCPTWREARLSVRPGITGLWQVMRTRRKGLDFQEWIKYDIEYVEHLSWRLDLWIIYKTVMVCLHRGN